MSHNAPSAMIVMVANNSGRVARGLAKKHLGKVGHIYSPRGKRGPFEAFPYCLDNGAYGGLEENGMVRDGFNESEWREMLAWQAESPLRPLWALVPDKPCDKAGTLERWRQYSPVVEESGLQLAIAVQDGMLPRDIPSNAQIIFVGGGTYWKWKTARMWCEHFPRVHIGRVNTLRRLRDAKAIGAESVDGTGWFRGCKKQLAGLRQFLAEQDGQLSPYHQTLLC